jgi:ribosome maturation factor RimP
MGKKEEISAAITPALSDLGFYLEDITITSAGRRSMLTVIVDGDTHLSLDQVTVATKAIRISLSHFLFFCLSWLQSIPGANLSWEWMRI